MQRSEIRLECLKLAHRHDRTSAEITAHATEYEKYVLGTEPEDAELPKRSVGRPKKIESGNSNVTS